MKNKLSIIDLRNILIIPLVLYILIYFIILLIKPDILVNLFKILAGIIIFSLGGLLLIRNSKIKISYFPKAINIKTIKKILNTIFIGFFLGLCVYLVTKLLSIKIFIPIGGWPPMARSLEPLFLLMLFIWFFHAFAEEIFFRGYVYNYLKKRMSLFLAILISCLFFTILHFVDTYTLFIVLIVSFVFTLIYEYYKNLIYPIIIHYLFNVTLFILCIHQIETKSLQILTVISLFIILIIYLSNKLGNQKH